MEKKYFIGIVLFLLFLVVVFFSVLPEMGKNDVMYINDSLDFSSLSLKQKIAQMIFVFPKDKSDLDKYSKLIIGGIFVDNLDSNEEYNKVNSYFIGNSKIYPFIVTDMEGCWNPFKKFYSSKNFSQVKTKEEAYELGLEHGKVLKENGFNMDFSPVLDLKDDVWKCRSFSGNEKEVSEKTIEYSKGLREKGIFVVAKHYPGKTLIEDPHGRIVYVNVTEEDLFPFRELIKENVSGIMLNHLIVSGEVDSKGKPIPVSQEVISDLRKNFNGLIITDEINMLSLKDYYQDKAQMYIDLFKSGNDMILNLVRDSKEIPLMISVIEEAVKRGEISEKQIDESVRRILKVKGVRFK